MACTQTSRLDAKFGINVLVIGRGPSCVQTEPFLTKRFSHVFGGLILIAQQLRAFTA